MMNKFYQESPNYINSNAFELIEGVKYKQLHVDLVEKVKQAEKEERKRKGLDEIDEILLSFVKACFSYKLEESTSINPNRLPSLLVSNSLEKRVKGEKYLNLLVEKGYVKISCGKTTFILELTDFGKFVIDEIMDEELKASIARYGK